MTRFPNGWACRVAAFPAERSRRSSDRRHAAAINAAVEQYLLAKHKARKDIHRERRPVDHPGLSCITALRDADRAFRLFDPLWYKRPAANLADDIHCAIAPNFFRRKVTGKCRDFQYLFVDQLSPEIGVIPQLSDCQKLCSRGVEEGGVLRDESDVISSFSPSSKRSTPPSRNVPIEPRCRYRKPDRRRKRAMVVLQALRACCTREGKFDGRSRCPSPDVDVH